MGERIINRPQKIRVCDICDKEIKNNSLGINCSNCGKEICGDCIAHHDEDYSVCKSEECKKAAEVLEEWDSCKRYGESPEGELSLSCELCEEAESCNYSYVKNPNFLNFTRHGLYIKTESERTLFLLTKNNL